MRLVPSTLLVATSLVVAGPALAVPLAPAASPPTGGAVIRVQEYAPPGNTPNGGYKVNRYGYGNYTQGTDGGFGGYPPGSPGAQILQEKQRRKCQAVPESC